MKYFDCNMKKLDLMKYVKEHMDNYMIIEEPPEYLEAYKMYTSASYVIKPNKFKLNNNSVSMHIHADNQSILLLNGTELEQKNMLGNFQQAPVDYDFVVKIFKDTYEIAKKFKFYDNNNVEKLIEMLEKLLKSTNRLQIEGDIVLKYGIVGKMTTGRSKTASGYCSMTKSFYITNDLTVLTCHRLEFPMKGLFKMMISILHTNTGPLIYVTKTENGDLEDITESSKFTEALESKFLERYQAAMKKWLKQDKAEFTQDNILLLEMIQL